MGRAKLINSELWGSFLYRMISLLRMFASVRGWLLQQMAPNKAKATQHMLKNLPQKSLKLGYLEQLTLRTNILGPEKGHRVEKSLHWINSLASSHQRLEPRITQKKLKRLIERLRGPTTTNQPTTCSCRQRLSRSHTHSHANTLTHAHARTRFSHANIRSTIAP